MRDIVGVTGMGIISSIGDNIHSFTESLRSGTCGIRQYETNENEAVNLAAKIDKFNFLDQLKKNDKIPQDKLEKARRIGRRAPIAIQHSIISALEAWSNANLFNKPIDPERIGIIVGAQNSIGNYQYGLQSKFKRDPEYLSPRYALEFLETNQIGILSELFGIQGEGLTVGGASATGNVVLIKGYQAIVSQNIDACLLLGVSADLSPMDIQGFVNIGAMGGKTFNSQPQKACRPFDKQHEGFIYGQASAAIILENENCAKERGSLLLAEMKGGAINLDSNSSANPNLSGEIKAMNNALKISGCSTSEINYINTHGSSSSLGDCTEAEAILNIFANRKDDLYINATKGLTGHCLYSAGMVEAISTIVQMKNNFIHPNINLEKPIEKELGFCGNLSIEKQINVALSNSFGFGGINSSIVLKNKN